MMKTLEYPMSAIDLSYDKWSFIMSPILAHSQPASKISSKFPHPVVYSSLQYQRLGIMHPYIHQGMTHLLELLKEGDSSSITGELFCATTKRLSLELRLGGSFDNWNYTAFATLSTSSWIKSIWQFCHEHNIQFHDPCPKLLLSRSNDHYLMQLFATYGYRKKDLQQLNECRMYLNAITVSDLTSAGGHSLTSDSYTFTSPPPESTPFTCLDNHNHYPLLTGSSGKLQYPPLCSFNHQLGNDDYACLLATGPALSLILGLGTGHLTKTASTPKLTPPGPSTPMYPPASVTAFIYLVEALPINVPLAPI
jgi:hypothetical protein